MLSWYSLALRGLSIPSGSPWYAHVLELPTSTFAPRLSGFTQMYYDLYDSVILDFPAIMRRVSALVITLPVATLACKRYRSCRSYGSCFWHAEMDGLLMIRGWYLCWKHDKKEATDSQPVAFISLRHRQSVRIIMTVISAPHSPPYKRVYYIIVFYTRGHQVTSNICDIQVGVSFPPAHSTVCVTMKWMCTLYRTPMQVSVPYYIWWLPLKKAEAFIAHTRTSHIMPYTALLVRVTPFPAYSGAHRTACIMQGRHLPEAEYATSHQPKRLRRVHR